jgi:hypothetical protein
MGGLSRAQAIIFAWLEEIFKRGAAAQPDGEAPVVNVPADFFALLAKYHGKEIVKHLQALALFDQRAREGSSYGHVRDPHSTTYSYRARLLRAALEA